MTSSGFSARSSDGLRLPAAQTIASATFYFPEPFGPTTTATPGSSLSSRVSGNDLKPRRRRERRCTRGRLATRADAAPRGPPSARGGGAPPAPARGVFPPQRGGPPGRPPPFPPPPPFPFPPPAV